MQAQLYNLTLECPLSMCSIESTMAVVHIMSQASVVHAAGADVQYYESKILKSELVKGRLD